MLKRILGLSILSVVLASCGPQDPGTGGKIAFTFAQKAIDGPCPEQAVESPAPPSLDRLEIEIHRADGTLHYSKSVSTEAGKAPRAGGIPEGDDLELTVIGYSGGTAGYSGSASGIDIQAGKNTTASVFMTAIGDMACANRPLSSPRAFLASAAMGTTRGNGRFVLAGGVTGAVADGCGPGCELMPATASVDIFDPGTGSIYPTRPMNTPRALASATTLADGRVLVAGGARRLRRDPAAGLPVSADPEDLPASFEIYLPDKKLWIEKPMPEGMIFHSASLLPDGRVLLAGGGTDLTGDLASDRAYLFDPAGESVGEVYKVSAIMSVPRLGQAAVLTPGGKVLLIGGAVYPTAAEIEEFTPDESGGVFSVKSLTGSKGNLFFAAASIIPLRPDEVLVAGGSFFDGVSGLNPPSNGNVRILSQISSTEIQSADGPPMSDGRLMCRLVATADGKLVMAGGFGDLALNPLQSIDAFDPQGELAGIVPLSVARGGAAVLGVTGGRALLAGGLGPDGLLGSAELFTPAYGP
ncbi:MAG TPA: hypothetical protein VM425_12470 [Myxococcota bacterium]|nr:hypothetical protein [Myxococcota bacterium]